MPKNEQDKDLGAESARGDQQDFQPKRTKKVKSISLGWAKPDDPIYTNAGWNFLTGKNLNPHIKPKRS